MATQATKAALAPEIVTESLERRPSNEQVATLAHALWQERGRPEGSPEQDWFLAEQAFNAAEAIFATAVIHSRLQEADPATADSLSVPSTILRMGRRPSVTASARP